MWKSKLVLGKNFESYFLLWKVGNITTYLFFSDQLYLEIAVYLVYI